MPPRRPGQPGGAPGAPGGGSGSGIPLPPPGLPLGLLAPPSIPVFPAGYAPVPGDFGNWVQSTLGFVTQKICFRAHQSVAQTLTSGVVTLDVVDEDPYGGWTAGGSNKWTAPFTGWYEVTVTVMASAGSGWLSASMAVTGGTRFDGDSVLTTSGNTGGATASQYVPMIGGQDFVTPECHASGSFTTEVIVPGRCSDMQIVYLSE